MHQALQSAYKKWSCPKRPLRRMRAVNASGLGNLDVADDIRVRAFLAACIHRCCGIAVCRAIDYGSVGVERARIQDRVDLRIRPACVIEYSPVNVVAGDVRRGARIPGQIHAVG
jgi:hypothetical protein